MKKIKPEEATNENITHIRYTYRFADDRKAAVGKDKREAQIRSFFGQHFKKKIYVERKEEVIELLIKAKTKQEVNNGLLKHFANETVSAMLKTLEPLIKDLPGR